MNKFNFYIPIDSEELGKAKKQARESGRYDNMVLEGVASDASQDSDGEILDPNGFILDRFLQSGHINYEHMAKQGGAGYIIGEPIDAKVENGKFIIKAKLYKGHKLAEDLWDTLIVMKENGSNRRLGWSIEGKSMDRDPKNPKRITKALITHCAATFMPKNYNTFADIVKGEQSTDFVPVVVDSERAQGGYILSMERNGKLIFINPDFSIRIVEKAMDTAAIAPLMKESLAKKVVNATQAVGIIKAIQLGTLSEATFSEFLKRKLRKTN